MNNVYVVLIPIPCYDQRNIYYQNFLFSSPPTKQDVLNIIETAICDESDPFYVDTMQHINNLKFSVNQVENWIMLDKSSLVSNNTHVNVILQNNKKVVAPFSWEKITVYTPNSVK